VSVSQRYEHYLREIIECSLRKSPEELLRTCLQVCIAMAEAKGGSILAEEGPSLQFLFANEPSLIGLRVPWDSIAGITMRRSVVVYTYAPSDIRHYGGVDNHLAQQTRFLLSVPIPSVNRSAESRQSQSIGALQLLFDNDILPGLNVTAAAQEFDLDYLREHSQFGDETMRDILHILPNVAFGMEVMLLRQTSYQAIHELKNKLIGAEAWLNCLHEDLEELLPDLSGHRDLCEDFQLASQALTEGANLAKNFLQFTRIYTPMFQDVNINSVVAETGKSLQALAMSMQAAIKINVELDNRIATWPLDPNQLKMALYNLGKNAVEALASVGGDNISLQCCRHSDGLVQVIITDNGPGMPAEIADNLFIPFKTKKEGGTGLGLTISKKIIDMHGGIISCQTGCNGTRFVIDFHPHNEEHAHGTRA